MVTFVRLGGSRVYVPTGFAGRPARARIAYVAMRGFNPGSTVDPAAELSRGALAVFPTLRDATTFPPDAAAKLDGAEAVSAGVVLVVDVLSPPVDELLLDVGCAGSEVGVVLVEAVVVGESELALDVVPPLVVVLLLAVLASGMWRLQVLGASGFRLLADANRIRKIHVVAPRGKISLAVDFDKNAEFSPSVNIVSDNAFRSDSRRFLLRRRETLLSQNDDGLLHVGFGFDKSVFAVHHSGAGLFPEIFY